MIKPYYIIPLLIEQPTWGGTYIAECKHIKDKSILAQKIGQAYELEVNTVLTPDTSDSPAFAVATATDLAHPQWYGKTDNKFTLQSLIDKDPEAVLGSKALAKNGPSMKTLIKFTQAKNNSYQVHVKPGNEFGHWLAKPESWFYFEPGLATLGLKPNTDVAEYQRRSEEIHAFAQDLSQKIKAQKLTVTAARQQLQDFINQDHPRRFVNTVEIDKHQVVDLSAGGMHHSWEVSGDYPQGNILYEVQVDVKDEFCTLRSFDQGNIKDDGSVRNLSIADYFKALDPSLNEPGKCFPAVHSTTDNGATITALFDNQYYVMKSVTFSNEYAGAATTLDGSFHHVFVQEGTITVTTAEGEWPLTQGWSLFVPAGVDTYRLNSSGQATVLITSV